MSFNKESNSVNSNFINKIIGDITFTQREFDVMSCIVNGRTSKKTIAAILSINPRTVITHTRNIMQKLQCTSWEYIPAFIEKSGNKKKLVENFNRLMINQKFETVLLTIKNFIDDSCHIELSYTENQDASNVNLIVRYLQFVGIGASTKIILNEGVEIEDSQDIIIYANHDNKKSFNYKSYSSIEDLTLDIINTVVNHKALPTLITEFKIFENTFLSGDTINDTHYNGLPKYNKFIDFLLSKKVYISAAIVSLICFSVFSSYYFYMSSSLIPQLQSEIKLPKESTLLLRSSIINDTPFQE